MKNENSAANWKKGLENAEDLAGYVLENKQAAWEDLHARLYDNKSTNKPAWYWMAAACLLIAVSFFLIKTGKYSNPVEGTTTQSAIEKKKPVIPVVVEEAAVTNNTAAILSEKEKKVKRYNKTSIKAIINTEQKINDSIAQLPVVLTVPETAVVELKDSAVQTITAIAPIKKKLKLVHVNELDDDGTNRILQAQKHLPARIRFLNQDIYTDHTASSSGPGLYIIKFHSTPSN